LIEGGVPFGRPSCEDEREMKLTASSIIAVVLALGAIAQLTWVWFLPAPSSTSSVEFRRAYFIFDLLFGSALVFQSIPFLNSKELKSPITRWAGQFLLAAGIFCILVGVSIAYRHMS
jgi:hypothetical protein